MHITATTDDEGLATMTLDGRFDAFETDGFRTAFDSLRESGASTVTVDLAAVQFVDSSALAELVRGMKRCRDDGGDLVLFRPSDPVRVILELTRLDAAFTVDTGGS